MVHLGLQLRVCCEATLELPALIVCESPQGVGVLEVVKAVAPGLTSFAGHPCTAIPRESKYSQIFFKPSLIRPLTVPSGRSRSCAISLWV